MIQIDKILKTAIQENASDVHLIPNLKPTLRVMGNLIPIEGFDLLQGEEKYELYDYFLRGNV